MQAINFRRRKELALQYSAVAIETATRCREDLAGLDVEAVIKPDVHFRNLPRRNIVGSRLPVFLQQKIFAEIFPAVKDGLGKVLDQFTEELNARHALIQQAEKVGELSRIVRLGLISSPLANQHASDETRHLLYLKSWDLVREIAKEENPAIQNSIYLKDASPVLREYVINGVVSRIRMNVPDLRV